MSKSRFDVIFQFNTQLVCKLGEPVIQSTWILKKNKKSRSWKTINSLIDILDRKAGR